MPKVSIIVPIYNVEKYLDRCMESLLNQTLKDIEIIMVDDGSPDNCPKMCDEYASKDNRVKVIHKKNAGLGYARNSGLEKATGEYVAFVDSDDYVEMDAYEALLKSAIEYQADAVFAGFKTETTPGNWVIEKEADTALVLSQKESYLYMLNMVANLPGVKEERATSMSVWHSIYKKSIIDNFNLRFPSEREVVCEDIPFQVDFFLKCKKTVLSPIAFYNYCLNDTSLTASFKPEKFYCNVKLRSLLLNKLGFSKDALLRVNRFFIGYTRAHMTQLVSSNMQNKYMLLKEMVENPVWKEVKESYKAKYLPFPRAVIYWLTIHKFVFGLYLYCKFFGFAKKITNKRT